MILASLGISVFAEEPAGQSHFSATTEAATVRVGDEFTVAVHLSDIEAATITGGINYDPNLVEFVSYRLQPRRWSATIRLH